MAARFTFALETCTMLPHLLSIHTLLHLYRCCKSACATKWLADFLTFVNSQRWLHGEFAWQPPEYIDEFSGESLEQQRFSVAYADLLKQEDMLERAFLSLSWHLEVPQSEDLLPHCEDLESEDAIQSLEDQQRLDRFHHYTGLRFLSTSSDSSDAECDIDFFDEGHKRSTKHWSEYV